MSKAKGKGGTGRGTGKKGRNRWQSSKNKEKSSKPYKIKGIKHCESTFVNYCTYTNGSVS
ncbi:DUF3934 family protein [Actinomycetes bacterium NPDC127524]